MPVIACSAICHQRKAGIVGIVTSFDISTYYTIFVEYRHVDRTQHVTNVSRELIKVTLVTNNK